MASGMGVINDDANDDDDDDDDDDGGRGKEEKEETVCTDLRLRCVNACSCTMASGMDLMMLW